MKTTVLAWLCLIVAAGATSCSSDAVKKDPHHSRPSPIHTNVSPAPEVVVQQFLTWFSPNQERLNSLPIVPAWLVDDGDTTDIYSIDFQVAEQYLEAFRSSGFFSKGYVETERKHFHQADSTMKQVRQWAGPPEGLNYDRVVFSQDPQADLEKLRRTKPTVTINGDTAHVLFTQLPKPEDLREGVDLKFLLLRQQGKWLIENIRPVFEQ